MSLTVQGLFIESLFSRKRHTFLSFTSHYKRTQFLNKLKVQKDQCCSLFQCFSVSVLAHLICLLLLKNSHIAGFQGHVTCCFYPLDGLMQVVIVKIP